HQSLCGHTLGTPCTGTCFLMYTLSLHTIFTLCVCVYVCVLVGGCLSGCVCCRLLGLSWVCSLHRCAGVAFVFACTFPTSCLCSSRHSIMKMHYSQSAHSYLKRERERVQEREK